MLRGRRTCKEEEEKLICNTHDLSFERNLAEDVEKQEKQNNAGLLYTSYIVENVFLLRR